MVQTDQNIKKLSKWFMFCWQLSSTIHSKQLNKMLKKKKKSLNLFILLIILKTSKTRDSGCAPSMGEGRMVSEGGYEVMGQL